MLTTSQTKGGSKQTSNKNKNKKAKTSKTTGGEGGGGGTGAGPGGTNKYQRAILALREQISGFDTLFSLHVQERTAQWNALDKLWDPLRTRFAWACPDKRALNILCHFSPLIEIGAGKGYWAHLIQQKGGDIVAFDRHVPEKTWTEVESGGPEMLLDQAGASSERNLFLCFPDEQESIAIVCLENFTGEYVIHVGELMAGDGTCGGAPQAPWGRTSSAEFQIALASSFHCLLVARLETRLPFARDCISVWKRTEFVLGREFPESAEDGDDEDVDEEDEDEDEENEEDDGEEGDFDAPYSDFNRSYFTSLHEQEKMLADRSRMNFYHAAIQRFVKPGVTAIDLGTGTGILAAFAERQGASKVYALDHSKSVLELARKVAAANNITRVEFVRKHSSEFQLKKKEKVDVIIHEQMGDCLFDEDMVRNVCDLRDRMLKPGGLVLPSIFELFVEPVKLDDNRHVPFIWDLNVHGIDFSCLRGGDGEGAEGDVKEGNRGQDDEYYHLRSCDPTLVDFFLCRPEPAYTVDLQTLVAAEMPHALSFSRKVVKAGRFDAFVVYFRASAGEGLSLSTGPHDEGRAPHWGYRILRSQAAEFKVGDTMDITLSVDSWQDLNSWRWAQTKKGQKATNTTSTSKKATPTSSSPASDGGITYMSFADLAKLRVDAGATSKAKKGGKPPVVDAASSGAVSFMTMSDLAKLRGESAGPLPSTSKGGNKAKGPAAADAVSFMSMSDLAKLRGADSSSQAGKRKSEHVEQAEEEEDEDEEDEDEEEDYDDEEGDEQDADDDDATELQRQREHDLDEQYYETNDKLWANVAADEMLPDRAVPSLQFLL